MQEFIILPMKANSFTESMKISSETYHNLKKIIRDKYGLDATAVGDEGGFAPNITNIKDALQVIKQDILEKSKLTWMWLRLNSTKMDFTI